MPALPPHLYIGRGAMSGPTAGPYVTFVHGPVTAPPGQSGVIGPAFQAPFDLRIERISFRYGLTGGADTGYGGIYTHPTALQVSGSEQLNCDITGFGTGGITTTGPFTQTFAPPSENQFGGGFATLYLPSRSRIAIRNVLKGGFVFMTMQTGANSLVDLVVNFFCCMAGPMNDAPTSD